LTVCKRKIYKAVSFNELKMTTNKNLVVVLATLLIIISIVSTIFVVSEANRIMRENLFEDKTTGRVTFSVVKQGELKEEPVYNQGNVRFEVRK